MNDFIFENATKTFFGKGCVKEYLNCLVSRYGDTVMLARGGSVMDCCKAISMASVYEGDVWNDFWARPGVVDFQPLPLGVTVTAAGTGSKMNGEGQLPFFDKTIRKTGVIHFC